jgi:hypothetical protein
MTVFVPGKEAGDYGFTSSLPVAILKLLAPDISKMWMQPKATAPNKTSTIVSKTPIGGLPLAGAATPAAANSD